MYDHNNNPKGKGGFADNPQNINRNGRPQNPSLTALKNAVANIENETGKNLFEHYVRLAIEDKTVLIDLMKKLVANSASVELDVNTITIADLMEVIKKEAPNEEEKKEE